MEEEKTNKKTKRFKGDITKNDFWLHYKNNAKEGKKILLKTKDSEGKQKIKIKKLEKAEYNKFINELLKTYGEIIVKEAFELKFHRLGSIRIKSKKLSLLDENGKFNKGVKVNWVATWEYWNAKYKGKTREEILQIPDKTLIRFTNEHTENEYYYHFWYKERSVVKYRILYKFLPSRQFSRLIAKTVKEPNRKVFYYS
jgi:hypothetical protein